MAADFILALARTNIAAGAAVVAVFALRAPLRRCFGAHLAYVAWLIVPLAAAGALMPASLAPRAAGPVEMTNDRLRAWLAAGGHADWLTILWLAGFLAAAALAAWRQRRFLAVVRRGAAGPAAVGVLHPRLVTPADFAERFTDEERRLVRAHERAHMDRLDARCNAAAALATWGCWFNPLLRLGSAPCGSIRSWRATPRCSIGFPRRGGSTPKLCCAPSRRPRRRFWVANGVRQAPIPWRHGSGC